MSFHPSRTRLLPCLLFLSLFLPQVSIATAQEVPSLPVLSLAAAEGPPATGVRVAGTGFTPGGRVYIAVYDRWGVHVYTHVWATATDGTEGTSGSQHPALGPLPAGTVDEVIVIVPDVVYGPSGSQDPNLSTVPGANVPIPGSACGRDLMVRAYDQQMAAWSNLLDVTALC